MLIPAPRLLLIAPHDSYRIAPYLHAAGTLGIDVLVASTSRHALIGGYADGVYVDLDQPQQAYERLLSEAERRPFAGIVGSDDTTVELAASIATRLGLSHNPPEAAAYTHRKDKARARLAAVGLPIPRHKRIDLDADLDGQIHDIPFPCVIKPLSLSGSRGVMRADDVEQLARAAVRLRAIVAPLTDPEARRYALVEEYISGAEVALEGLLRGGELTVLALFDKPDPLEGPFFEETYYITPSRHSAAVQQRLAERVAQAARAYGLREGPVHAELRLWKGDAWIMEVAARTIGGQCARLLRHGAGQSLEELVVAHAVGRPLDLVPMEGAAGVLMIPIPRAGVLRRVEGVLAAQQVPYIEDLEITVRSGYELVPLPEGSSYLGFIFARGPTPEAVEKALRRAHSHLNIVTAPLLPIFVD